ncbi:pyridoxal-5-phosphate-dependent protein subunit beta [candidate division LCP-89 bacterium B3_LCP]|uniref:Pyridoxal-5-phosphate-dependent protein subunit beta n=1 Tax=candidate division LCP-89 bacterium B3_LCP TaxID=2012998 RepID=A0A532URQ0_UNCL8|nr:MAG: pyridoxal-5-phosphate-dependent protein subunit beta [candidate division LCP-89 bacterium B3_LCP]
MDNKIIPQINPDVRSKTIPRCRELGIIIPTFKQLQEPELIPDSVKEKLPEIGMQDIDPLNLFRITWKNDVKTGLFGKVNFLEVPPSLSGVKAKIIGLVGKHFPTGSHKVGAAFGCLVPRLVSGQFDPEVHKAVWPSTGNYCRGGAFDCALLKCDAVAILPEEMSQERFRWLKSIGAEVIATPGCESNVKEIYDKCWELREDPSYVIFNQFDEFGNSLYHHHVTGRALEELLGKNKESSAKLCAFVSATGSAGTIAAGDYLKTRFPHLKIIAAEALQCPTLLMNGFGGHRIEGIGDKHVPWIHNVRNTDVITGIDDEDCMRLLRLFNEPAGKKLIASLGIPEGISDNLHLLGISSICNLLAAIKTAKYFELNENDVILTVFTDSADLYQTRLQELTDERGVYKEKDAIRDYAAAIEAQKIDYFKELSYYDRKAIHNLKYYTWVEQQGKTYEEITEQWHPQYWDNIYDEISQMDELIEAFNHEVGL